MKKKLEKLYNKLNELFGDNNPFQLKKNRIEYDDGTLFIIAKWCVGDEGSYHVVTNVTALAESKSASDIAKKMFFYYQENYLDKSIWGLFGQFKPYLTGDGLFQLECNTGIGQSEIENIVMGDKNAEARDLHDIAWALGKKLVLVDL